MKVNGKIIPIAHTVCASAAFIVALVTGCYLHYYKIIANAHYQYPDEWFPSVSATIGDRYPERSIFQILIALTALPRFLLLLGQYYLYRSNWALLVGVLRTVSCGGWVYITSTDDHDVHDFFMISYIVLTLPYDFLVARKSKNGKYKYASMGLFFGTLVPLIYWYIQHQIKIRPGAYSRYAYFEWSLIFLDIVFDGLFYQDFKDLEIILNIMKGNESTKIWLFQQVTHGPKAALKDSPNSTRDLCITENMSSVHKNKNIIQVAEKPMILQSSHDDSSNTLDETANTSSLLYLLCNLYNSFIFWTMMTSLSCSIWHFPLWNMGASGYELAVLAYLSSIFLYIPLAPQTIRQFGYLLGGLITIGAVVVDYPEDRLMTVAIGTGFIMMTFAENVRYMASSTVNLTFAVVWLLGLVCSVVIKMAFYSNNPLWAILYQEIDGQHDRAFLLMIICGMLSPYVNKIHFVSSKKSKKQITTLNKVLVSIGFGSVIFNIHQLMTDSSTLIFWSWEGYKSENQGPLTWPWSFLVCASMLLGAVTSPYFYNSPNIPSLLLSLSTALLANKRVQGWHKFIYGGLPYVLSIMWIVPTYVSALSNGDAIWMFFISSSVHLILILIHLCCVAYAFLPYGWLFRESVELLLVASAALTIFGVLIAKNMGSGPPRLSKKFYHYLLIISLAISLWIGRAVYIVMPEEVPEPLYPETRLITAGIWTVHFGLDNNMWASENRMRDLIQDMELDVVGLLETDTQHILMGNRDITKKLSHDLNMYVDYGPGPNKNTWGCCLLSKFPILNSTHHLLPSPSGELAPAIHATLQTYDDILVDVFVFHSGQEEDEVDRWLQSHYMAELMGSTDRPAILLSYLVTKPGKGNYNTYVSSKSGMHDIDPDDHERWCEYILYKNLKRTGYARVSRGSVTDTELQVGKFQVPDNDDLADYAESLYTLDEVEEPEDPNLLFPDRFYGYGDRGHYYHVLDKPKYYE